MSQTLDVIRQSTLGDADTCLRRLQYSVESPYYHGGIVRAIGTAYHKGLETWYKAIPQTHDLEAIVAAAIEELHKIIAMEPSHESELTKTPGEFKWDDKFPDAASAGSAVSTMLEAWWQHPHAIWNPLVWDILGVEVSFNRPLWDGIKRARGSVDLIVQNKVDGWIVIEDHKTAGKKWPQNKNTARKSNQAPWYVRAMQDLFPDAPGIRFTYGIMTYGGVFERREVHVTEAHIAAVEAKALQVATLYDGMRSAGLDLPTNSGSNLCNPKWCDHWDICPHGGLLPD